MSQMHRQSLVAYGQPLCETVAECPSPRGGEVLVRIERCGVCHSDLHLQDGYFTLGADKKLDVSAGRTLPFTLGHEIAGVIERVGGDTPALIAAAGLDPTARAEDISVAGFVSLAQAIAAQRGLEARAGA